MSDERKLQVSATIKAPVAQVFALLADPARHTGIDGAGMLRGLETEPGPVSRVGDFWVMNMNQDGIGDYRMRSEVVTFQPDRAIAWAPAIHPHGALSHIIGDADPSGHVWSWELEATSEGRTRVTHTYDWSGVKDESALVFYPRVSEEMMSATITRISDVLS